MANPEHLSILKQGVEAWNRWRQENEQIRPDLSDASLADLDIQGIDFRSSYLPKINLSGACAKGAFFNGSLLLEANFQRTDLSKASMVLTDLTSTNFTDANLSHAFLLGAIFRSAILIKANLAEAVFGGTVIAATDAKQASGLDRIKHFSPSSIGLDTIFKSQGKIPESFLRGCGVPEDFIRYLPSFFSQPFQFYSCFISHSSKDAAFCQRLHADLQASKVRTWYFPEDAKMGKGVWAEIDRGIHLYDKLVVVCSEASLNSGPVLREIERALNREDKEGKEVLFPIRLDGHVFAGWDHPRKADLMAKVVGDFSAWKDHDAYQKAFARLLAALQAEG